MTSRLPSSDSVMKAFTAAGDAYGPINELWA